MAMKTDGEGVEPSPFASNGIERRGWVNPTRNASKRRGEGVEPSSNAVKRRREGVAPSLVVSNGVERGGVEPSRSHNIERR